MSSQAESEHLTEKGVITTAAIAESGKLNPAGGYKGGVKAKGTKKQDDDEEYEDVEIAKSLEFPVLKANEEKRTVTGIVLEPEVVDAQLDIYSAEVIEKAAENFLAKYNKGGKKGTKLGIQHSNFDDNFELLQSYIAPVSFSINRKVIPEGAWIIKVRVKKESVWKKVKEGKLTGFSIGGKARVRKLKE